MRNRKLKSEKLWVVENYFRTHGSWRSSSRSHVFLHPQCSQNPRKSIISSNKDVNLTVLLPISSLSPMHRSLPLPPRHPSLEHDHAHSYTPLTVDTRDQGMHAALQVEVALADLYFLGSHRFTKKHKRKESCI